MIFNSLLSSVFHLVTSIRNYLYDQQILRSYAVDIPIICIGNVSVGGNGKTPLVMFGYDLLKAKGYDCCVLLRGYKGRELGPKLVNANDRVIDVGDEACMYYELGYKVVVSKDRLQGARFIKSHSLANVIILDDGFQHRRLKRNLNIITVNFASLKDQQAFLEHKLLPAGLYRESLEQAFDRIDAIVFSFRQSKPRDITIHSDVINLLPDRCRRFVSYLELVGVVNVKSEQPLLDQEVFLLTAIANPEGFIATLEQQGFKIVDKMLFKDHHYFNADDIDLIIRKAQNLPIICTEKDLVKLKRFNIEQLNVLKTKLVLQDKEKFEELLLSVFV